MKKKGFVGDLLTYFLALFLLSIVFLTMYYVLANVNDAWQNTPGIPEGESKTILSGFKDRFVNIFDRVYLLLVLGYLLVTIIIAWFLRSMPVFAWLAFLVMIVFGIVAVHLANSYNSIATTASLVSYAEEFVFMTWLAQKLPFIVVILGVVFIIVMYSKSKSDVTI